MCVPARSQVERDPEVAGRPRRSHAGLGSGPAEEGGGPGLDGLLVRPQEPSGRGPRLLI